MATDNHICKVSIVLSADQDVPGQGDQVRSDYIDICVYRYGDLVLKTCFTKHGLQKVGASCTGILDGNRFAGPWRVRCYHYFVQMSCQNRI